MKITHCALVSASLLLLLGTGCAKKVDSTATPASTSAEGHADNEKEPFQRLTIEQLEAKMQEAKAGKLSLAIYDNNEREMFDGGHIPSAKWLDSSAVKAGDLPASKDTTLVFYCANEH